MLVPNNEMLDLLEFGMPSLWQKAMILQDVDPIDHTMAELLSFCERLELTEPELEKNPPRTSLPRPSLPERKGKLDSRGTAILISKEIASSMEKTVDIVPTSVVQ